MQASFFTGTSGWSYPDWKGAFYPDGVGQSKFLEYYATHFPAVELNASFYRLPSDSMVAGWRERAPAGFRFCVKLLRLITHLKRLRDPGDALDAFLNRFKPLGARMGPVLAQLPPSLAFEAGRVEPFLKAWRRRTRRALAVEARHASWLAEEARELLTEHGVALVRADSGGRWPTAGAPTADFAYLRYHGPKELYASGYSPQKLGHEAARIAGWLGKDRAVWAFFNNTDAGHAWADAARLREFVERRLE